MEADGVVSYPIKTAELEEFLLTYHYRNAEQALKPEKPCLGSVDEPIAEKGNLCVYRGGAGNGSKEGEDKGVNKTPFFESFFGVKLESQTGVDGQDGVKLVFRTNQFNTTGGAPATLTEPAYMVAAGSWAVTAP